MTTPPPCTATYGDHVCKLRADHVGLHESCYGIYWYGVTRFPADKRYRW